MTRALTTVAVLASTLALVWLALFGVAFTALSAWVAAQRAACWAWGCA